jgi:hypothetical protein
VFLNYPYIPSPSTSPDNRNYAVVPTILLKSQKGPSDEQCLGPTNPLIQPCLTLDLTVQLVTGGCNNLMWSFGDLICSVRCSCRWAETVSLNCGHLWVCRATVEWYWQGKTGELGRKTCPNATLSTTNSTWIDPGANPGLRGERPAANDLSPNYTYQSKECCVPIINNVPMEFSIFSSWKWFIAFQQFMNNKILWRAVASRPFWRFIRCPSKHNSLPLQQTWSQINWTSEVECRFPSHHFEADLCNWNWGETFKEQIVLLLQLLH